MSTSSTKDEGEIDLAKVRPPARRDEVGVRERDEAAAFQKTDGRTLKRKGRTELISYRIYPQTRATMERISKAENISLVEVVEKGVELYDKVLKGQKL